MVLPMLLGECALLQPLDLVTFSTRPHAPENPLLRHRARGAATEADGACTAAKPRKQ